mgnify:CR=1 FL=1
MKKSIEIDKDQNTVTIEVSVDKRNYAKEPIISFRTKDIILLLEKEGIQIDTCLQSDTIYNTGRHPKTEGKWVFKVKGKQPKVSTKPILKEKIETEDLTTPTKPAMMHKKHKKRK